MIDVLFTRPWIDIIFIIAVIVIVGLLLSWANDEVRWPKGKDRF